MSGSHLYLACFYGWFSWSWLGLEGLCDELGWLMDDFGLVGLFGGVWGLFWLGLLLCNNLFLLFVYQLIGINFEYNLDNYIKLPELYWDNSKEYH
jgi:hypothetical protein